MSTCKQTKKHMYNKRQVTVLCAADPSKPGLNVRNIASPYKQLLSNTSTYKNQHSLL